MARQVDGHERAVRAPGRRCPTCGRSGHPRVPAPARGRGAPDQAADLAPGAHLDLDPAHRRGTRVGQAVLGRRSPRTGRTRRRASRLGTVIGAARVPCRPRRALRMAPWNTPALRRGPGRGGGDPHALGAAQAAPPPLRPPHDPPRPRRHGRDRRHPGRRGGRPPGRVGHQDARAARAPVHADRVRRAGDAVGHRRRARRRAHRPARRRRRGRGRRRPAGGHAAAAPADAGRAGALPPGRRCRRHAAHGRGRGSRGATAGWCTARTTSCAASSRRSTPPRRSRRSPRSTRRSTASAAASWRRRSAGSTPANVQGEYYLTDAVSVLFSAGYRVQSLVLRRPDGGRRGQRPGPAGRGRSRAAGPDQRALDAPGRDHVGPRAHLRRRRGGAGDRRLAAARA